MVALLMMVMMMMAPAWAAPKAGGHRYGGAGVVWGVRGGARSRSGSGQGTGVGTGLWAEGALRGRQGRPGRAAPPRGTGNPPLLPPGQA